MISRKQLKNWLNVTAKKDLEESLETYIDGQLKKHIIDGDFDFTLTASNYLSLEDKEITRLGKILQESQLEEEVWMAVLEKVIQKYKDFGFQVSLNIAYLSYGFPTIKIIFEAIDHFFDEENGGETDG
jgi:hypothetical protein